ncbi:MAG: metallophosphoesterase [Chloroflexi bacterium]|nr:metallophosphoesterase [Chloroflexota bacterium]
MTRRKFLKLAGLSTLGVTAAGSGTLFYGNRIELFNFDVVEREMALPRLAASFDGYRIAHISDLHHDGEYMNRHHLNRAIDLLNQQNADMVIITGDFVTHKIDDDDAQSLLDNLSAIKSRDGMFAVPGNHDYWTDIGGVRSILSMSGVADLSNAVFTLERDGNLLNIAGVDDYWEQLADISSVINQLPDTTSPTILMAHEPDYADISAATGRFDLQLSGHSHGGQVRLPLLGSPILPRFARKYPAGQYQVENMIQYTNRGLGVVDLPLRINCPPEITIITLRAS